MVFGLSESLRNELEAVTEERNYFQAKFLEQISVIKKLETELKSSKREINRLRRKVMTSSTPTSPKGEEEEKKHEDGDDQGFSPRIRASFSELTNDDEATTTTVEDDPDVNDAIRESASKLLQWASYRETKPVAVDQEEEES